MKEFNINVHVQVGVTEQLYALLSAFACGQKPSQEQAPAQVAPKPAPVETRTDVPEPQPTPAPASDATPEEAPQQQAGAPAPEADKPKEYTEADVRAAMDRTRRRIEGEDYKENTAGEGYKKYHQQLTGEFKRIATLLGAEKPSALPDSSSRASFIKQCDELVIEGGELTTKVPF